MTTEVRNAPLVVGSELPAGTPEIRNTALVVGSAVVFPSAGGTGQQSQIRIGTPSLSIDR